jgi:hypothetical protein
MSVWVPYNRAKGYLASGDLVGPFRMALYAASSNCTDVTLTAVAALTGEIPPGNGYATGGVPLMNVTTVTVPPDDALFKCNDVQWIATGGSISAIRFAVISEGPNLIAFCDLTGANVNVSAGTSLVVGMAKGVLALS